MKEKTICNRLVITAEDGMVLMRGDERIEMVLPADGVDESAWYEITEEEYQKIIEEKEN